MVEIPATFYEIILNRQLKSKSLLTKDLSSQPNVSFLQQKAQLSIIKTSMMLIK